MFFLPRREPKGGQAGDGKQTKNKNRATLIVFILIYFTRKLYCFFFKHLKYFSYASVWEINKNTTAQYSNNPIFRQQFSDTLKPTICAPFAPFFFANW